MGLLHAAAAHGLDRAVVQRPSICGKCDSFNKVAAITRRQSPPGTNKDHEKFESQAQSEIVVAIDNSGTTEIFASSKAGIVASRFNNNQLAVADGQVIVLHNTRRGQDRSWGLSAHDDEVRLLESTTDGFFLTTKLTHGIMHYDANRGCVGRPLQVHNATPVAMASSKTFMLLASKDPPFVSLKNLTTAQPAVLMQPRASGTSIVLATFHPSRPHIFLLGFSDGLIAGYNTRKCEEDGYDGEFGRTKKLHRDLTACAFLPGHESRIVSVGLDGRCRVSDLKTGIAIRTWHVMAPVTCISAASDGTIAIGRLDGKVRLYSGVGVLQAEWAIVNDERVISLEWVAGTTPFGRRLSNIPVKRIDAAPGGLGLPQALRQDTRFTVHPDELSQGTVIHRPVTTRPAIPIPAAEHPDLLSSPQPLRHRTKPPRPRVTARTFVSSRRQQKAWHPGNVLEREVTWLTDSVQDSSMHEQHSFDGAWQTSDEEAQEGCNESAVAPKNDRTVVFEPASEDVRALFPRTSSLSPARRRKTSKQPVSPWNRARTAKSRVDSAQDGGDELREMLAALESDHRQLGEKVNYMRALLQRKSLI
ncbi:hypothetical protein LTR78_005238 [Recurvomyces mirabilis]|uniref:WD40 repeat-like protein n=1 Tax=Recurvomyces mirabilis TaxID=574656 RepID=A0AAE1C1T5_9PEZI|nr:hypothetical protein LTR78_005238 [Recurvomyces mirabilis]KAK5157788.1 hypothetical protein LTS14_003710 [Recurvomyces mirabilis]